MIKYLEKSSDFEALTKKRCLVDFYADWCGPCQMMGQVLEKNEDSIDIPIIKINTDKHSEIATKIGVMSIPTLILMENSKEIAKKIGFMPKEEIIDFIKQK